MKVIKKIVEGETNDIDEVLTFVKEALTNKDWAVHVYRRVNGDKVTYAVSSTSN